MCLIYIIFALIICILKGLGWLVAIILGVGIIYYIGSTIKKIFIHLNKIFTKNEKTYNIQETNYDNYLASKTYDKYKDIFLEWIVVYCCNKFRNFFQIRNKFINYILQYETKLDYDTFTNIDFDLCLMSWIRILLKQHKLITKTNGFERRYYIINKEKLNKKELEIFNQKEIKDTNKRNSIIFLSIILFLLFIALIIINSDQKRNAEIKLLETHIDNNTLSSYPNDKESELAVLVYINKYNEYIQNNQLNKVIDLLYMLKEVYNYNAFYNYSSPKVTLPKSDFYWFDQQIKNKEAEGNYYYQNYQDEYNSICKNKDSIEGKLYYYNYYIKYNYAKSNRYTLLSYNIYYKNKLVKTENLYFEKDKYCSEENDPKKIFEKYYNENTHYIYNNYLITLTKGDQMYIEMENGRFSNNKIKIEVK